MGGRVRIASVAGIPAGAARALEKAAGNGLGRLPVLESGRLVGYLSLKDITHVLVLRGLGPARTVRRAVLVGGHEFERAA